jgi:D-3-phosphoglycerate dehydrogenase
MKIVILDDYQDAVRTLNCFPKLAGHAVTIYHDTVKDPAALAERLKDAEAVVLIRERSRITGELLARLPGLRLISQTGGGFPHIDVAACTRYGVAIAAPVAMKEPSNPGKQTSSSTAELTFALIMASLRHLPQEVAALKAGKWQTTLGRSLFGQTLGIYGFGLIGSQVAGYGRAFGMNVLVWGREGSLNRAAAQGYAGAASRESFFETADVISLHLKLSDDTRGMVNRADLGRMKPSALLVNTSRAGLVEPGALLAALAAGRPGFAALDVYEDEPVGPDNPWLALPNVICTPHLGYVEKTSYENLFSVAFDQVNAFAAGQPINIVNLKVVER